MVNPPEYGELSLLFAAHPCANAIVTPVAGKLYDVGLIYTRVSQNMKEFT
jgi:hypothetical protein